MPTKTKPYLDEETLTHRQWMALAWLLFKTSDKLDWRFVCPSCKTSWSVREFRDSGQDADCAYQQCIKRKAACERDVQELPKGMCDWAAFGLFRGPWVVKLKDDEGAHEIPVFPYAGATKDLVEQARIDTDKLYAEAKAHHDKEG
jgi:hypothetical protein